MNDQKMPILLNMIAGFFGAFGQYYYKKGAAKMSEVSLVSNWNIWVGALLFTLVMVLFTMAYKMGGKITVVYPFYATTFLWGFLIGVLLEKEAWSALQLAGVVLIVVGVSMIACFSPSAAS